MNERAEFVRDAMRKQWGSMTARYTQITAGNTERIAETLLRLAGLRRTDRVLDVATGTGVVAVLAAERGREVVATDLAPEWQSVVDERAAKAGLSNVTFRAMSADALQLPDASFDVVLCQLGLMFVPTPLDALREMHRVLRDDGRLAVVVWSTLDRVALFRATGPILAPYLPRAEPSKEMPTPLALGEPGLIERLVAEAGFGDVRVERHVVDWLTDEPEARWQNDVVGPLAPAPNRDAVEALSDSERADLRARFVASVESFRRGGKIVLPSEAIYVTARR